MEKPIQLTGVLATTSMPAKSGRPVEMNGPFFDGQHVPDDPTAVYGGAFHGRGRPPIDPHLQSLGEAAPDIIFVLETDGFISYVNPAWEEILGHRPREIRGCRPADFAPPEKRNEIERLFSDVQIGGRTIRSLNIRMAAKDGTSKDLSVSATACRDKTGRICGAVGMLRDRSGRRRIEKALRRSEQKTRALLEAAPDPVIIQDMGGKTVYINPAFTRLFGWRRNECVGQRVPFIPENRREETKQLMQRVQKGRSFNGVETWRLTKDGRVVEVSVSGTVFSDHRGRPESCIFTLQDIREKRRKDAELKFAAFHDSVTGLPNRKSLQKRLGEILTHAGRRSSDRPWALLVFDLDRFKQINSSLGHDIGDELLRAVAARVQRCLRSTDYFSRLGGDEFTIILTDLNSDLDVARVARKILTEIEKPYTIFGQHIETTVSIGISLYPEDGREVESLMRNADMAMCAAKEEGAGYRFFTEEMNLRTWHRMKIEGRLRHALARKEMLLYYQPLVDRQQRIVGVEALLRWKHPELGLLAPNEFIGIAEETGAIISIGKWVMEAACRQVKKWRDQTGEDLFVAVNLSARQFRDPNFAASVLATLTETGLPAKSLKLEVTESCVMEQPETAIQIMRVLRRHQISFSIDDFGTGYSSFSYLKRFPIDTLKIDRCFIKDFLTSRGDREIIRSIVTMARNLRLETIAEGVETAEQYRFLQDLECSGMQGFYFGRPLPANEWEEYFSGQSRSLKAG